MSTFKIHNQILQNRSKLKYLWQLIDYYANALARLRFEHVFTVYSQKNQPFVNYPLIRCYGNSSQVFVMHNVVQGISIQSMIGSNRIGSNILSRMHKSPPIRFLPCNYSNFANICYVFLIGEFEYTFSFAITGLI